HVVVQRRPIATHQSIHPALSQGPQCQEQFNMQKVFPEFVAVEATPAGAAHAVEVGRIAINNGATLESSVFQPSNGIATFDGDAGPIAESGEESSGDCRIAVDDDG